MNKRENIYSLKGFSKVFKFTLIQTFKNKGYIVSFVLFVVIMTIMGPLQYFMSKNSEDTANKVLNTDFKESSIEKVYVYNETPFAMELSDFETYKEEDADFELQTTDKGIKIDNVEIIDKNENSFESRDEWLGKKDMIIYIHMDEESVEASGVRSDDSDVDSGDMVDITNFVLDYYDKVRLASTSADSQDIIKISTGVDADGVISEADYYAEQNKTISGNKYFTYIMGFSVIVMMIVSLSNSFIIASVTEEKQSKLVESLLVSVRPMALLMGKIFGMMSYVLSILICGFIGSRISDFVLKDVMKVSEKMYSGSGLNFSLFKDFGPGGLIILLVALVLGYLTFAILGGIMGSACVKTEDIQNATGSVLTIVMAGYMGAMFLGMMDHNILNVVISLVPPFSYFSAPIMFVTGRISLGVLLGTFALQIVFVILLMRLCAKTYRNLILSDSSTPKFMTIIKSARV